MEKELNYLSEKIDELVGDLDYAEDYLKTEGEIDNVRKYSIILTEEIEFLNNIVNYITERELTK